MFTPINIRQMTELEELLEDLNALHDRLDTMSDGEEGPSLLTEAKEALEEAIDKIEDYVNAA